MVLDLELSAQCGDHSIIEIRIIVCDDSFRDTVSTDEILFDESGHNILGYRSEKTKIVPDTRNDKKIMMVSMLEESTETNNQSLNSNTVSGKSNSLETFFTELTSDLNR